MKGVVVLAILLLVCLVVYGKPRPRLMKRVVKRQVNTGFNALGYREDQLNLHNYYRSLHGVPPLTLDPILSLEAQEYANSMMKNNLFQHCGAATCNPSGAAESISKTMNATEYWYKQVHDFNFCSFPQGRATPRPGSERKMIFDFTQLVWATTKKLGIGFAQSADGKNVYVVARYSPPGNYIGQFAANVPRAAYLAQRNQENCFGVNGGFTAWSKPGPCSKSCGKGIRYQTRSCTNPKPSFNGKNCVGESKKLYPYWCNEQKCAITVNERNEQCLARGHAAISYNFGGKFECSLMCQEPNLSNFYKQRGNVNDGTICQSGNGTCIDGLCVLLDAEPATLFEPSTTAQATTEATTMPTTAATTVTTTEATTTTTTTTTQPTTTTGPPTTVTTTVPPTVLNGGYSDWSLPGPCSKTCGGGISFRTRKCLTPQPGGGCIGSSREVHRVWCNPQPCDPPVLERNKQCKTRGYEAEGHNFGGVDECYLYCRDTQSGYFFYRGSVDPGTPCNKTNGACADNICVPMVYEPGTRIEGKYTRVPSPSYWKNIILAIPNGSTNIQIIHNNHEAEAVVGYRSNTAYGYDAATVVKGVKVIYHLNSDITIDGPVYPTGGHQLVIYALGDTQADIIFKYTPPTF